MLSDLEREEIEEEIRHCPVPKAACLDALKVIQRHRGWVADEQVAEVAEVLGGLRDGDQVIAHPSDRIANGVSIAARSP